jgi:hypothetical protein
LASASFLAASAALMEPFCEALSLGLPWSGGPNAPVLLYALMVSIDDAACHDEPLE